MLRTSYLEAPLPLPRARGIYRVKGLGDWLYDLGGIPIIVPFADRGGIALQILRQIMFAVPGSEVLWCILISTLQWRNLSHFPPGRPVVPPEVPLRCKSCRSLTQTFIGFWHANESAVKWRLRGLLQGEAA